MTALDRTFQAEGGQFDMSPEIAPVMSTNVWDFIAQRVGGQESVSVLEYGSGGSTVYLHRMLLDKAERSDQAPALRILVAVESDLSWFITVIRHIQCHVADKESGRDGGLKEQLTVKPWSLRRELDYFWSLPWSWRYALTRRKAASVRNALTRTSVFARTLRGARTPLNPKTLYDADYSLVHENGLEFHYYLRGLVREDWRDETDYGDHYVHAPEGAFDFVLIDGSHRKACLERVVSAVLVKPTGIVFHHDADKDGHQDVLREFGHGAFIDGNGVGMTPGPSYQGIPIPHELWYWSPADESIQSTSDNL